MYFFRSAATNKKIKKLKLLDQHAGLYGLKRAKVQGDSYTIYTALSHLFRQLPDISAFDPNRMNIHIQRHIQAHPHVYDILGNNPSQQDKDFLEITALTHKLNVNIVILECNDPRPEIFKRQNAMYSFVLGKVDDEYFPLLKNNKIIAKKNLPQLIRQAYTDVIVVHPAIKPPPMPQPRRKYMVPMIVGAGAMLGGIATYGFGGILLGITTGFTTSLAAVIIKDECCDKKPAP